MKNNDDNSPANEIVVYQPNEVMRLEVRLENETIWLTQQKIADLFGVGKAAISKHVKNIFATGELVPSATVSKKETVQVEGGRRIVRNLEYFNLDMIIAVGYRVNSHLATQFRIWATSVLRDYLLRGYSVNARMNQLEDKVDRRFAKTEQDISELRDQVDFFVKTAIPPVQGVFYDGQVFDAKVFATKYILSARKSIFLIDSWVDMVTLEMLAKKKQGVTVEIVTSRRGNRIAAGDIAAFNAQYGGLSVRTSDRFHDRFVIVDDRTLYLFGASLKDLGKKCFAFTKLDPSEIGKLRMKSEE